MSKVGKTYEIGSYVFIWPKIPRFNFLPRIRVDKVEVEEDAIVFGHRYDISISLFIFQFTIYLEIQS